jgi:hypothetical protein
MIIPDKFILKTFHFPPALVQCRRPGYRKIVYYFLPGRSANSDRFFRVYRAAAAMATIITASMNPGMYTEKTSFSGAAGVSVVPAIEPPAEPAGVLTVVAACVTSGTIVAPSE